MANSFQIESEVIASFLPAQTQIQHSVPRTGGHIVLVPFIAAAAIAVTAETNSDWPFAGFRPRAMCSLRISTESMMSRGSRIPRSEPISER